MQLPTYKELEQALRNLVIFKGTAWQYLAEVQAKAILDRVDETRKD
jgi:hypothetical protein